MNYHSLRKKRFFLYPLLITAMNLFENKYADEPREKLPTLLQYIKSRKKKAMPKAFHIAVIWLPNRFPSYAIETDLFRLSIASTSLMGKALEAEREAIERSERSIHLGIALDAAKLRTYSFLPGTTEGSWVTIGTDTPLGIKFIAD